MTPIPISKDSKKWLIIAGVALLFLLIVGIVIWRSAKRRGQQEGTINISSPASDDAGAPAASSSEIRQLAEGAYADMKGMSFFHDADFWKRVLALSDTDFAKVNNEFNYKYQRETEQSLRQWIENETDMTGATQWSVIKSTLLSRMSKLNIV